MWQYLPWMSEPLFYTFVNYVLDLEDCATVCFVAEFKAGRSPILIATDVAARGLGKLKAQIRLPDVNAQLVQPQYSC